MNHEANSGRKEVFIVPLSSGDEEMKSQKTRP